MRSRDRREPDPAERFGVRLPGVGPHGQERRHYPDLLLTTAHGRRVAVELELTPKGRARRTAIMGAYAFDHQVHAVVYLVPNDRMRRAVESSARQAGIGRMVHVRLARFGTAAGAVPRGRSAAGAVRAYRSQGRDAAR
jgi:hypothetical protein